MKIYLFAFLIALVLTVPAFAQTDLPVIGTVADIKTLKRVYLITESTKDREQIALAFKKKKSKLEIVGDPKDADFFLEFKTIARREEKVLSDSVFSETGEMTAYLTGTNGRKTIAWSISNVFYDPVFGTKTNSYACALKFLAAISGK